MGEIPEGRMAVGVGVHGESGGGAIEVPTADVAADLLVSALIEDLPFREGDDVCVLVNDGGSMTLMELSILYRRVHRILDDRAIDVHSAWLGRYATTQESPSFAIALCRVDEQMKRLYDAPAMGGSVRFGAPIGSGATT